MMEVHPDLVDDLTLKTPISPHAMDVIEEVTERLTTEALEGGLALVGQGTLTPMMVDAIVEDLKEEGRSSEQFTGNTRTSDETSKLAENGDVDKARESGESLEVDAPKSTVKKHKSAHAKRVESARKVVDMVSVTANFRMRSKDGPAMSSEEYKRRFGGTEIVNALMSGPLPFCGHPLDVDERTGASRPCIVCHYPPYGHFPAYVLLPHENVSVETKEDSVDTTSNGGRETDVEIEGTTVPAS